MTQEPIDNSSELLRELSEIHRRIRADQIRQKEIEKELVAIDTAPRQQP